MNFLRTSSKKLSEHIDLHGSFIRRTDFSFANLEGANFENADCTNAIFRGANFKNTNLRGTILHGADLSEVTNLTETQLKEAKIDSRTILPEYLRSQFQIDSF